MRKIYALIWVFSDSNFSFWIYLISQFTGVNCLSLATEVVDETYTTHLYVNYDRFIFTHHKNCHNAQIRMLLTAGGPCQSVFLFRLKVEVGFHRVPGHEKLLASFFLSFSP